MVTFFCVHRVTAAARKPNLASVSDAPGVCCFPRFGQRDWPRVQRDVTVPLAQRAGGRLRRRAESRRRLRGRPDRSARAALGRRAAPAPRVVSRTLQRARLVPDWCLSGQARRPRWRTTNPRALPRHGLLRYRTAPRHPVSRVLASAPAGRDRRLHGGAEFDAATVKHCVRRANEVVPCTSWPTISLA